MRLLQELINNNEGGWNDKLIIAKMETILGTIVYTCRYPFDQYFEKSFIPHINSIINLLRCEDKVRAKQLLEVTNYIKWNSLCLAIICDPENSNLNQDQRMSPILFQHYHRGYDQAARQHIRERCVGMRPIMNSIEFLYHPDMVFDNLRHYKWIARVNAVQTTNPPPRDDNDTPPNIRSVTNIEEGPYAPVNLEENFSAYITPSTINNDEQNVARTMPTETLYEPESNLMDYVERVMDRRLSLIMDTIRKEEKLPLKSDPNEHDSLMAYLKDPPLTSLTTSPITKITITVKSEGREPNLPQLDNNNGKNSSSSQSAAGPKKKRTAAAIVRDMNKVTTMSTFLILQYDADTLKQQNGFQLYICALQNVLMNKHKLSTVLIQFPTIQSVTDESAQRSLFLFVQSAVLPGYYAHLDLFVKEYGSHDGCAALQSLQTYVYCKIRRYNEWRCEPTNICCLVRIRKSFRSTNISIEHIC
jgi:hypothetical protein